MLDFDDVPFGTDLYDLETEYMPVPNYSHIKASTTLSTRRDIVYDLINSLGEEAALGPVDRYAAMSYYDMFASRNNFPVIEECEDKSYEVFATACVVLVGNLEDDGRFNKDTLGEEMFELTKNNMAKIKAHMLRVLDWRVHLITPMAFFNHLFLFLYTDDPEHPPDTYWLRVQVQHLIWAIHIHVTFTEYKPSVIMAAAMLAAHPVEDYQLRLANCPINMATLERCLATMRESAQAKDCLARGPFAP